jgi:hypothetical protein
LDQTVSNAPVKEKPKRQIRFLGWRKSIGSRMPEGSSFYSRVLPGLVILLGILMALVIVAAIAVFLGLIA